MKNVVVHHTCSRWISTEILSLYENFYEHVFSIYTIGFFFRFDVAGAGASLKRYSDPSFFRTEHTSNMLEMDVSIEKKPRRVKVSKRSTLARFYLKTLPSLLSTLSCIIAVFA